MSNTSSFASRIAFGAIGCVIASVAACKSSEHRKGNTDCSFFGQCIGTGGSGGTGGVSIGPDAGPGGAGGVGAGGAGAAGGVNTADKVDLLLMIDNSRGMADKQALLRDAVPVLLDRLINPLAGEFRAIDDIHVGIITSSLGGHGADQCSPAAAAGFDPSQDDRAQLLPSVRSGIPQYGNTGFLVWDASRQLQPPGESNRDDLMASFAQQVPAAGEHGCGFEASLEAWYRFLIDPDPPQQVIQQNGQAVVLRPNQVVLQQRRAFLRPDSLLAVIMLTDENDCSIFDGGVAWLVGQGISDQSNQFVLPKATAACNQNPNDLCCRSCNSIEVNGPPAGCQSTNADPQCAASGTPYHNESSDPLNLRCWDQKRRFGVDFLYSVARYIEGLTSPTVQNFQAQQVPNPLYMDLTGGNRPVRSQRLVFLAGIIGVPWQDIATAQSLGDPNTLEYLTGVDITQQGRWEMILGDPSTFRLPNDALMVESPFPRTDPRLNLPQSHPLLQGVNLVPETGPLRTHPINGNEYLPQSADDLQYACIFPLDTPRDCAAQVGCECRSADASQSKPLCNGTVQTHAKAYPGLRHLQVLKGIGEVIPGVNNAIVASICPKISDGASPAHGYNPAMAALIERLKERLGGP